MYSIGDLFDKRSIIGTRIEQILEERSYTKTEFCKRAGISRPTLDKLLTGSLTNKTNYEKHLSKILDCLSITPDMLLSNVQNRYNRGREIRSWMRITTEEIAESTGISLQRLKEIESGEKATLAELRDIALQLSVSVRDLCGEGFFETQAATLDFGQWKNEEGNSKDLSGFWGHIGILPSNSEAYLWFPITANTRKQVYNTMNDERMVIPCMNNKVLYLNMENIKEIMLLDEACDEPDYANWDPQVDCGNIPLVVYEALEDYLYSLDTGTMSEDILSTNFQNYLDRLIEYMEWDEDTMYASTGRSVFYYKDGRMRYADIDFNSGESISSEISSVYDFGDGAMEESLLFCHDTNGAEILLNVNQISVLEFPLLQVEEAICDSE